jgi:uncharacterized protein YbcI
MVAGEKAPGEVLAEISTELVKLHRRVYGRGPEKVKSFFADETVICLLYGGLTVAERTLIAEGHVEAVHRLRRGAREAMEAPAKTIVEKASGCPVIAYMGEIHPGLDLTVEVFVLEET